MASGWQALNAALSRRRSRVRVPSLPLSPRKSGRVSRDHDDLRGIVSIRGRREPRPRMSATAAIARLSATPTRLRLPSGSCTRNPPDRERGASVIGGPLLVPKPCEVPSTIAKQSRLAALPWLSWNALPRSCLVAGCWSSSEARPTRPRLALENYLIGLNAWLRP
jgi:hypothetical protein